MLSFSLRLLRPWELGWGQYLWLQVIVVSYHKLMHQKSVWKKPHGRGVLISLRTLWLLLAEEYDSFLKQAAPWEEKKKDYMVKCQNPSRCQRDWQQFLVLLEYVSSWESINVLQASRGRMKASPSSIVYASCQAWGREGGPGGKGICHHVLEEER